MPTFLHIDCAAVVHNLAALRALMPSFCKVAAVVKADAYGHGALRLAPLLKRAGVEALAVANTAEALALRRDGIGGPIWLLLGAHCHDAPWLVEEDLWPLTADMELLRAMAALGREFYCLLKVDSGMNRLGLPLHEVLPFLEAAARLPGIKIMGLHSHLTHGGDPMAPQPSRQVSRFNQLLRAARQKGYALECSAILNSGGIICPPEDAFSEAVWVRPGVALYGGLPDPACAGRIELRGAMSLRSRIIAVHPAPSGSTVSYGAAYTVPQDTWLAVVPVGYADGYQRALSNRAEVLINNRLAPLRGRVCMNMVIAEVGHISPLPQVNDEAVLLGRQQNYKITVDNLAQWAGTIGYEIMCGLGAGLPHYYLPEEECHENRFA